MYQHRPLLTGTGFGTGHGKADDDNHNIHDGDDNDSAASSHGFAPPVNQSQTQSRLHARLGKPLKVEIPQSSPMSRIQQVCSVSFSPEVPGYAVTEPAD